MGVATLIFWATTWLSPPGFGARGGRRRRTCTTTTYIAEWSSCPPSPSLPIPALRLDFLSGPADDVSDRCPAPGKRCLPDFVSKSGYQCWPREPAQEYG